MPNDDAYPGYEYLGSGPTATGEGNGWSMSGDLAARCCRCGDFVSLGPAEYGNCRCGAIHKDPDAGRFGSALGGLGDRDLSSATVSDPLCGTSAYERLRGSRLPCTRRAGSDELMNRFPAPSYPGGKRYVSGRIRMSEFCRASAHAGGSRCWLGRCAVA